MTRATKTSAAREHGVGLPKALRKPKNEPLEAVIFDMDGVVAQSLQAHFAAWREREQKRAWKERASDGSEDQSA